MKFADLHIHSYFSDSSLSSEDIFKHAYQQSLSCISVTDHDNLDFYSSGDYITFSKKYSIEVIKGIELSTQYQDKGLHLLGYFADFDTDKDFLDTIERLKHDRYIRIVKIIDILSSLGLDIKLDEFNEFVKGTSLSRLNLAIFMKHKKIVKDIKEAFSKYIGVGKPAYLGRFRYDLPEAIGILKKSKALVFLAHPLDVEDHGMIASFIQYGLDGIEVFYPSYSRDIINLYKNLAEKLSLLISGGSDSHGKYKRHHVGSAKFPYEYVERIKHEFGRVLHK